MASAAATDAPVWPQQSPRATAFPLFRRRRPGRRPRDTLVAVRMSRLEASRNGRISTTWKKRRAVANVISRLYITCKLSDPAVFTSVVG